MFYKLVTEITEVTEKLHKSIEFNNLICHYKGSTANSNYNNFINAATRFCEIKSNKIEISSCRKHQMDFKSNLSDIKIGGKNSDEQINKIENIAKFYNVQDKVSKIYQSYLVRFICNDS